LTLDLFTRHGSFWDDIAELRSVWKVNPVTTVPPEPDFHAEMVGLTTRYHMPERFHFRMPPGSESALPLDTVRDLERISKEYPDLAPGIAENLAILNADNPRTLVGVFLLELREVWRAQLAEDERNGTNVMGWMSWVPFLSACVMFDPPRHELEAFAEHDDHNAAALPQVQYRRDADTVTASAISRTLFHKDRDVDAGVKAMVLARASHVAVNPPTPYRTGSRGRPADDLRDVQCAILRRDGMRWEVIAERYGWSTDDGPYKLGQISHRPRSAAAETAAKRGELLLRDRGFEQK